MTVHDLVEFLEEMNPHSTVVSPWVATIDGVTKSGYTEIKVVETKEVDGKPVTIIG